MLIKNKTNEIKKENAIKIFRAMITQQENTDDFINFFKSIKDQPKIAEYIIKNNLKEIKPAYNNKEIKRNKSIKGYLVDTYPSLMASYDNSLKKEFNKEIKKLKFSNYSKFWKNIIKDIKSSKNQQFFDLKYIDNIPSCVQNNINQTMSDLSTYTIKASIFHNNDCTCLLILSFKLSVSQILEDYFYNIVLPNHNTLKSNLTNNFKKILTEFLSEDIATTGGDGLGEAIDKYVKDKKITFKQAIEKLNKILDAIGKLRLKDILKDYKPAPLNKDSEK